MIVRDNECGIGTFDASMNGTASDHATEYRDLVSQLHRSRLFTTSSCAKKWGQCGTEWCIDTIRDGDGQERDKVIDAGLPCNLGSLVH